MTNLPLRGVLLCLIPPLIWGGMFPLANHLLPTVNMFAMTLIRYGSVAIILALLLARAEGFTAFRFERQHWRLFLLGSAGFAGFGILAFTALKYTPPTNVSLIMATMPAISAALAAVATKRMPPAYTVIAILIAFFGVSVVLTDGDYTRLGASPETLGGFLALLGAICWVVYTRGAASLPSWSALRYTTLTTLLSVPTIATATIIATSVGYVEAPSLDAIFDGWFELTYLIVPAGVIAVLFWNQGNMILGPLNGTLFMNLVPVTTFTIITISSRQLPTLPATIGVALVISGLLLNNLCMRRAFKRYRAAT